MPAGASSLAVAPLVVDPVDYLLVDIAVGRHLPGGTVHAAQLAHEHGLTDAEAIEALEAAWLLGFVSLGPGSTSGLVTWTPEDSLRQLHRLAGAMVSAVAMKNRSGLARADVIDGEAARMGAVELFGLTTPGDVELFLELARAVLGCRPGPLVDDLVVPVAVLFSVTAQSVHGLDFAAPAGVRERLVSDLVRCLIDGRVDDFAVTMSDYVLAMSVS
jgi:hypothetical protein